MCQVRHDGGADSATEFGDSGKAAADSPPLLGGRGQLRTLSFLEDSITSGFVLTRKTIDYLGLRNSPDKVAALPSMLLPAIFCPIHLLGVFVLRHILELAVRIRMF